MRIVTNDSVVLGGGGFTGGPPPAIPAPSDVQQTTSVDIGVPAGTAIQAVWWCPLDNIGAFTAFAHISVAVDSTNPNRVNVAAQGTHIFAALRIRIYAVLP